MIWEEENYDYLYIVIYVPRKFFKKKKKKPVDME